MAATLLVVGASFYAGARLRNYSSYGVLLAGYTALLVAYGVRPIPFMPGQLPLTERRKF